MISLSEDDRSLGWWSYVLAAMILGISLLMVSNVRYPSFKKIDLKTKANVWDSSRLCAGSRSHCEMDGLRSNCHLRGLFDSPAFPGKADKRES